MQLWQTKIESAFSNILGHVPMQVDHARNKGECYFCKKRGHCNIMYDRQLLHHWVTICDLLFRQK